MSTVLAVLFFVGLAALAVGVVGWWRSRPWR